MGDEKIWVVALIVFALFALGGLYIIGTSSLSSKQVPDTGITVSGSASTIVDPDEVIFYLKIETLHDNASDSQAINAEIYEQVKAALLAEGINEEDIKTTYYNLDLKEECEWYYSDSVCTVLGYETIHEIKVVSSNVDGAGKLLDAVADAGATIDYVSFQLSDEAREELENQLIGEAVLDAKEKAEKIADAVDMQVGKLLSANYGTLSYYSQNYYSYELMDVAGSVDAQTSLAPGEVEVSVSVTTVFDVN